MSRLKIPVNLPGSLDPAVATEYAQAAVDELARAYQHSKPSRLRGGLRTSFTPGADPVVLVFPRVDLTPAFDQLLDRGAWADPSIAYLVAALGGAIYGLTESAAVLALTASHGVALRAIALWNRSPGRPFDLGLRIAPSALQLSFDPRRAPRTSDVDELAGVKEGSDPPIAKSVVVSAQTLGTRALVSVADKPDGWVDVAVELFGILRRKWSAELEAAARLGDEPTEPGVSRLRSAPESVA